MATITTRSGKGSPLTNNEVDANFSNLNTDKVELDDISASTASASGTGSLTYNNASGVFTYTPPAPATGTVTPSSSDTFTNKSGAISQWTNDANYSTTTGTVTPSSSDAFTNKSGAISQWTNDTGYAVVSVANTFTDQNTFTAQNTFTGGLKSEGAGADSLRIGRRAGLTDQESYAIALGYSAGKTNQKSGSIAIGNSAGFNDQKSKAVAIGLQAGKDTQGSFSVAIGNSAGKTNQGNNGIIINANGGAFEDTTDGHIHVATDEASIDYTSAAGFSVTSTVAASNKFTAGAIKATTYNVDFGGIDCGTVAGYYGLRIYSMNGDYFWAANTTPASYAMHLTATTGNLTLLGICTATSFVGSGSALTGLLNLADLKTLVAASADFADFQTRIAAL